LGWSVCCLLLLAVGAGCGCWLWVLAAGAGCGCLLRTCLQEEEAVMGLPGA